MRFISKKKKNTDEFIAVTPGNKKYTVENPFSEDLQINGNKAEIHIMEDEEGFTFLIYKNKKYLAEIIEKNQNRYSVVLNGVTYSFSIESPISYKRKKYLQKTQSISKTETILAPMPGKILDILVEENTIVKEGEAIAILEAMKMQNEINAPIGGKVRKILVKQNDTVAKDEVLLEIER